MAMGVASYVSYEALRAPKDSMSPLLTMGCVEILPSSGESVMLTGPGWVSPVSSLRVSQRCSWHPRTHPPRRSELFLNRYESSLHAGVVGRPAGVSS